MASSPQTPPNWGPTPPAPPGWMPPSAAPAPAPGMMAPTPATHYVPFWKHEGAMLTLSRYLKVFGLAFFVIGLLVAVAGASYPGSCYTTSNPCNSTSGSNWYSGALWALLIAKVLMVLGLAGIALGALFKMRGTQMPTTGRRDDLDFVLADRRWNGYLLLVTLVLLFLMIFVVNTLPVTPLSSFSLP